MPNMKDVKQRIEKRIDALAADTANEQAAEAVQHAADAADLQQLRYATQRLRDAQVQRIRAARFVLTPGRKIKVIYHGREYDATVKEFRAQDETQFPSVVVEIDKLRKSASIELDSVVLYGWE